MAMTLYDNAFSPFARKVRMVLELKGLDFDTVDGLDKANAARLEEVNQRAEVPTLVDESVTVVNSADIVAYLERAYPEPSVYPCDAAEWARARAWELCADSVIDSILIDISYWLWAERSDEMPDGMLDAARRDMATVYDALERDLDGRDYVCGELSVADIALFPHMTAVRAMKVAFSPMDHPGVAAWFKRLRGLDICGADLERTRAFVSGDAPNNIERRKLFWRGDRIEWLLARGYHDWFMKEIVEDRVIWPGLGVPGPRA